MKRIAAEERASVDVVLINPRFEVSYWGLEHALPIIGKRANLPVACLPLLAALTPREFRVTLIDENVEPIDFDRVARADIVGVTGMSVQRARMRSVLEELKARGVFTVVGGPWVSVQEDYFGDLADVIFVGEAEESWPQFLKEWQEGRFQQRYEQAEKTDMTKVPVPRHDLLKMRHYLFGSVQFTRGCPFQCEFCDIIVTFGRRPRLKTAPQIIAELESLRAQKMHIVFIVDDNLIGNKNAVKALLADVIAWQRAEGYPLTFFTEASLDLAEDAELMQLMVDANIQTVFIGIESPNEESLRETLKLQNLRPAGTLVERVRRVQQAGLDVWCGMIVGFDHDDPSIFAAQRRFLRESRILHAMIGMLTAIPKTPLYARLAAEGRLDLEDETEFGTNVVPLKMTREELRDGYLQLMRDVYEPEAYFERLEELYLRDNFQFGTGRARYWRTHWWSSLKGLAHHLAASAFLYWRLMHAVPDARLRREYRRRITRLLKVRKDPVVLFVYLIKCLAHYHHYTMATQMAQRQAHLVNSF
ncbi:MAG: radical SAM protein [Deltaproteobacteria bacterium]